MEKVPDEVEAPLEFAFNLFTLIYQLQTFTDDPLPFVGLQGCIWWPKFRALLGVVEIARGMCLGPRAPGTQ